MCSTTAAFENGQRDRSCTCDPSVPSRVYWLLHYALRNGGPEGICTLSLPADNGLLRWLSYGSVKWWEVLVTLQSSLPTDLVTPGLQPGGRNTSLKLVAGVGVAPTEAEVMGLA